MSENKSMDRKRASRVIVFDVREKRRRSRSRDRRPVNECVVRAFTPPSTLPVASFESDIANMYSVKVRAIRIE
jgi:hypothetical protein